MSTIPPVCETPKGNPNCNCKLVVYNLIVAQLIPLRGSLPHSSQKPGYGPLSGNGEEHHLASLLPSAGPRSFGCLPPGLSSWKCVTKHLQNKQDPATST